MAEYYTVSKKQNLEVLLKRVEGIEIDDQKNVFFRDQAGMHYVGRILVDHQSTREVLEVQMTKNFQMITSNIRVITEPLS